MRIRRNSGCLQVWLSARDTYNWAHKPGAIWPCSTLSSNRLYAEFDSKGNLVDFTINGKSGDCDVNEFNAIISDLVPTKE